MAKVSLNKLGNSIETTELDATLQTAISKAHNQNTDAYLDFGGSNECSASALKALLSAGSGVPTWVKIFETTYTASDLITVLQDSTTKLIFLPNATISLTSEVNITSPKVIIGGYQSVINCNQSLTPDGTFPIHFHYGSEGSIVMGVKFTMPSALCGAILIDGSSCVRIENCSFLSAGLTYGYRGIHINSGSHYNVVRNNYFYLGAQMLVVYQANYNVIEGNTFNGCGRGIAILGASGTYSVHNRVAFNSIYYAYDGITLQDYSKNNVIQGNLLQRTGGSVDYGFRASWGSTTTVFGNLVIGNKFYDVLLFTNFETVNEYAHNIVSSSW